MKTMAQSSSNPLKSDCPASIPAVGLWVGYGNFLSFLFLTFEMREKIKIGVLLWFSGLRTQHAGSTPGLAQWVNDLVLPQATV